MEDRPASRSDVPPPPPPQLSVTSDELLADIVGRLASRGLAPRAALLDACTTASEAKMDGSGSDTEDASAASSGSDDDDDDSSDDEGSDDDETNDEGSDDSDDDETVKVKFVDERGPGEVRAGTVRAGTTFPSLRRRLKRDYGASIGKDLTVGYMDEEGDFVTIREKRDWSTVLRAQLKANEREADGPRGGSSLRLIIRTAGGDGGATPMAARPALAAAAATGSDSSADPLEASGVGVGAVRSGAAAAAAQAQAQLLPFGHRSSRPCSHCQRRVPPQQRPAQVGQSQARTPPRRPPAPRMRAPWPPSPQP